MTYDEWNNKSDQMPLWQFLKSVHGYTELVKIRVIIGMAWIDMPRGRHIHDFYLTEDAFIRSDDRWHWPELERLLKYYAEVPVWNVTAEVEDVAYWKVPGIRGDTVTTCITARCHFNDLREAYEREQNDIRREKRREYDRKRRAARLGRTPGQGGQAGSGLG